LRTETLHPADFTIRADGVVRLNPELARRVGWGSPEKHGLITHREPLDSGIQAAARTAFKGRRIKLQPSSS
jgi:hypothetical protein